MSSSLRFKGRKIFFSYAPQDKKLFKHLMKQLALLKSKYPTLTWYDSNEIGPGNDITQFLEAHLNTASIIVLLLSAEYFASQHCYEQMQRALARGTARVAHLIPVLLRPIDQDISPLARYNPLPSNKVPVMSWSNPDEALAEVAKGIRLAVEALFAPTTAHPYAAPRPAFLSNTSYGDNDFFTDRGTVLAAISSSFASAQNHHTPILALNGPGGIGKTQIARAYSSHPSQVYQNVLWLNASSRAVLSQNVSTYAAQFSLPEDENENENEKHLFIAFKQWLQDQPGWLLVLDYLEDIALIDLVVPPQSSGHVLLTTRIQATGRRAFPVTIASMDIDASALFLLRRVKILSPQDSLEQAPTGKVLEARTIAQTLSGFPLALDQAAAYIEETGCSFTTYLDLYQQRRAWLLSKRGQLANDHHESVIGTFDLAFEQVAQKSPANLDLLRLLAFLYPDAISEKLFMDGAAVLHGTLRSLVADSLTLLQAFAALLNFSLIYWSADRTLLQMHRIVQDVLIDKLTMVEQRRWARLAVRLVNSIFPEVRFETWADCQRYLPHAQHCATLITKYHLTLKEGALLLERLGSYRFRQASYTEAETYLTQALELYEHHLHTDTLDAAQTMNSLARLHSELAHFQKAKALHLRALELREQELDAEHHKTVESLHNLAMLYGDQGLYKQAEDLYLRVLPLEERSKGPDHPDVAKTLNNLGLMYFHQKYYSEAETAYRRALTIDERSLSPDDPDLMHPLDGLGSLAEQQGNYQQAELFYQRALAISMKTLGEKHPETAHCINKLAGIAESGGDDQQAEKLYQQALAIGEQALGPEHPDVALFLNNLALLANKQGQYQKAEPLYQRALSIYERTWGSKHPDMALFLNNLGRFYHNTENEKHAEALLRRALVIQKRLLDPTDPDITVSLNNLADLLIGQQRYAEAAPLLQRALAILLLRASAPEHPDVELVREKYATLLECLHRNEEAQALRQAAPKQEGPSSTEPAPDDH